ncbi:hypothetical protein OA002_02340 [bacterium]|nr:hypothetical protein [bacterium]
MAISKKDVTLDGLKYNVDERDRVAAKLSHAGTDAAVTFNNRLILEGEISGSTALPWPGLSHSTEAGDSGIAMISGNTTLAAQHFGKTIVQTAASVITLPAVAIGVSFVIVNGAADGTLMTISPNADDKFLINAAGATGTNNKDIVNTAATAKKGDYIHITYGSADGWTILSRGGIFADQS